MLEGVDDAAALRTSHLALALVASECGKLGGTTTMLNAELGEPGGRTKPGGSATRMDAIL
jgi:hypothetical protein